MAADDKKLTKYKSAVTIVTADVANSWFGGLYGSSEASNLEPDDPKVIGHVHDGQHLDGHAQKIDLVDHVTNQLRNQNLADDSVTVRNIRGFINQANAIPEFEIIDSVPYYYLDLSDLRASISESGEANDGANVGTGAGEVFRSKDGVVLNFKTIKAGSGISVTNNPDEILIASEANIDAENLPGDEGLFYGKNLDTLQFKSLSAGSNITLSSNTDSITISAVGGEVNTGDNVGTGTGEVFRDKTGTTLNFKTLQAGDGISLSNNSDDIVITNDGILGASNMPGDEGLFLNINSKNIQLKSLSAGSNISLSSDSNTITISATDTGESNTGSNVGVGSGKIYKDKTGDVLNFKSIQAGDGIIISNGTDDVTIANNGILGAVNLPGSEGIFTSINTKNIQLKSLNAGSNISLSSDSNAITISATGITESAFILDVGKSPNVIRQNVTTLGDYASNDFVVGSPTLEDTGDPDHDHRLIFDKSIGAFRVGGANAGEWDTRGSYSFGAGLNNVCSSYGATALAGVGNTISGSGQNGFVLGATNNIVDDSVDSGILASKLSTINEGNYSYIIGGDNCEVVSNYASARALGALADSPSKWAIGAGEMNTGRGRGSAQGAVYICKGRNVSGAGSTIELKFAGTSFRINNNSIYNVDMDFVIIRKDGSSTSHGGGRAHSIIVCNSTGAVSAHNNGIVYGNMGGFIINIDVSTPNSWFPVITEQNPPADGYTEVVCHIRTTEAIVEMGVLNSSSLLPGEGDL